MKTRQDPITGILCREDGAVKGRRGWQFGWTDGHDGYVRFRYNGETHLVHRLICRAFHGIPPEGMLEVDHIDRTRNNNRASNLRWVDHQTNQLNHGKPRNVPVAARERAQFYERYHGDEEFRKRHIARARRDLEKRRVARRAKMAAKGFVFGKGPDGRFGWQPLKRTETAV